MIAEGPGAPSAPSLPEGSPPALAIEQEGDWIEVRISDAAASEAQMEASCGPRASTRTSAWPRRGFADRLVIVGGRAPEPGEQPSAHPEVCGDARVVR